MHAPRPSGVSGNDRLDGVRRVMLLAVDCGRGGRGRSIAVVVGKAGR
jgi:hypothetical protein